MRASTGPVLLVLALIATGTRAAPAKVVVTPSRIDVDLAFPAPTFTALADGVEARVGSYVTHAIRPGQPRLPMMPLTVVLPPGTRVASVDVTGAPVTLGGAYRFAWGQEPQHLSEPPRPRTPRDERVYGSDVPFPATIATLAGHGFYRGYRVATLQVWPLQVRPFSGRVLAWNGMRVTLSLEPDTTTPHAPPRGLAADIADLGALAINPETAYTYGTRTTEAAADVPYLVIAPASLAPAFERLVVHRRALGMNGALLTLESVLAGEQGRDDAEKVRNAIGRYYREHGTTFVLLGGDDMDDTGQRLMPTRVCADYDAMVSDYYFGALDGDWDTNANGHFCEADEVDYYSEVHVGRATVDTLAEANHWIDKVLLFDEGLTEDRRTDVVFMGEKLDDSTWGEDSKERIAPDVVPPFVLDRLYARNETFSAASVIAALNRGPQLVNHDGHASADYVMGIGIGDVEALHNASPFVAYSIGCYPGAFDQGIMGNTESISEHFLLAPHAAAAVVMNNRYGWYYVGWNAGLSADLDKAFFDALLVKGLQTVGEADDDSRAANAATAMTDGTMRYCFLETNLHGDPAMKVQVRRPQLQVTAQRVIDTDPAYGNGNGTIDPNETVELALTLGNAGTAAATGIEAVLTSSTPGVTVHDDWAAWPDIPAGGSAENLPHPFTARFDVPCGSEAAFRLEIRHDGVVDVATFSVTIGSISEVTIRNDKFETDSHWIPGGTATQGQFVREDPNPTSDPVRGIVQDGEDHTPGAGTKCWVTGNPSTGDPALGDVKSGNATITSPTFNGTGDGRLLVRFARFYHRTNIGSGNTGLYSAKVSTDTGSTWTEVEHLETNASAWVEREIDLSSLVVPTATMRVRFEAVENIRVGQGGEALTELMIDDVSLVRRVATCAAFTPADGPPPGAVGPTLAAARAGDDVVLTWAMPATGPTTGPARYFPVFRSTSPQGGFSQSAEPAECTWHDCECGNSAYGSYFYIVAAKNAAGTSGEEPLP